MASRLMITLFLALAWSNATTETTEEPTVPFRYALGMGKFEGKCAECHGEWAQGTAQGPPLRHPYYLPGHHPDAAFYRAIRTGTTQHHWNFGDMPAVEGVTQKEAQQIIEYVRWMQQNLGMLQ